MWHGGGRGEPDLLASCYRTSLTRALELNCRTVAFPAISTGVYHYPPQEAAAIAVAECPAAFSWNTQMDRRSPSSASAATWPPSTGSCWVRRLNRRDPFLREPICSSHPRHGSRKHQASGFHSIAWIFERSLKARRSATPACPRVRFMIH